jgi:hypothetical protein
MDCSSSSRSTIHKRHGRRVRGLEGNAIHHTTSFVRKGIDAGERLDALYEVNADVAILCALLSLDTVLRISGWIYDQEGGSVVADDCKTLRDKIVGYSYSTV